MSDSERDSTILPPHPTAPALPSAKRRAERAAVDENIDLQRAVGRIEGRLDEALDRIGERFDDGKMVMDEHNVRLQTIVTNVASMNTKLDEQIGWNRRLALDGQSKRLNTMRGYGAAIILLLTSLVAVILLRSYDKIGTPRATSTAQAQEQTKEQ